MDAVFRKWSQMSLVLRILIGLLIGAVLGLTVPHWTAIDILGIVFVSALKAIAPILVAVTITVMTLAVARTVGVDVSFMSALFLSIITTFAACGASGVAGGSLLLVSLACSFFNISNDVAMQAVAVGFIIGVVQDSVETALNSSGDVFFTATAEYYDRKKREYL